MIILAILSLLSGWLLGQFFKVFVLIPAIGLAIPVVFVASVFFLRDTPVETFSKIAAVWWLTQVGYALGQMLLILPFIVNSWRKVRDERIARLHARRH
jgi:hypothetical protein